MARHKAVARKLIPVRLDEVPVSVRLQAAHRAARDVESVSERMELLAAALAPSHRVYWVPAGAAAVRD